MLHHWEGNISVSFRIFVKEGSNVTIAELGVRTIVIHVLTSVFSSARDIIVLITLLKLEGSGDMFPQET